MSCSFLTEISSVARQTELFPPHVNVLSETMPPAGVLVDGHRWYLMRVVANIIEERIATFERALDASSKGESGLVACHSQCHPSFSCFFNLGTTDLWRTCQQLSRSWGQSRLPKMDNALTPIRSESQWLGREVAYKSRGPRICGKGSTVLYRFLLRLVRYQRSRSPKRSACLSRLGDNGAGRSSINYECNANCRFSGSGHRGIANSTTRMYYTFALAFIVPIFRTI